MEMARAAISKEVDIVELIRSNRFVHLALKHLLDPTVHKQLKARSQFKKIWIETADPPPLAEDEDARTKMSRSHDIASDLSALPDANDVEMVDHFDEEEEVSGIVMQLRSSNEVLSDSRDLIPVKLASA